LLPPGRDSDASAGAAKLAIQTAAKTRDPI
jgi:hypothetical protein